MELIPAIDIFDGQVVQLISGDFDAPQVFDFTPVEAAQHWVELGAKSLHVVDLNAVRSGVRDNTAVAEILRHVDVPVQASGGIGDLQTATQLLALGVHRVIINTTAIAGSTIVHDAADEFGNDRILIGINTLAISTDTASDGSKVVPSPDSVDLVNEMRRQGAACFIYTDVDRAGTHTGPNTTLLTELNRASNDNLTVAGGIGNVGHLETLAGIGINSVVLGSSIYTGSIDYEAAVRKFSG